MKRLGNILILIGLIGVVLGVGSVVHIFLHRTEGSLPPGQDPDGDARIWIIVQRLVIGVGGGMLTMIVGAWAREVRKHKRPDHDAV